MKMLPGFFTVIGRADDGAAVALPDYSAANVLDVEEKVLSRARREGFTGMAGERLAQLGWQIVPAYAGVGGNERAHMICLCPDCVKPKEPFHLNSSRSVAVGEHEYLPMKDCPKNVKVILLGPGRVATLAAWDGLDPQWLGWYPLPREPKEMT